MKVKCDGSLGAHPIIHVMRHAPPSVMGIAPEKTLELKAQAIDITFHLKDSGVFECHYRRDGALVTIGRKTVEFFWACAHAYVVLWDRVLARKNDEDTKFDLTAEPDVHAAMRLLQWAFEDVLNGEDRPWPDGVPFPVPAPSEGSPENVATELCLVAVGCLLHHELAHHYLGHGPTDVSEDSLPQEREADQHAIDWILSGVGPEDPKFVKRILGWATAYTGLTALSVHSGSYGGGSHPRTFDRLFMSLDRWIPDDPYHVAWGFVAGALRLHLDNSVQGDAAAPSVHASFRTCVDSYCELLANRAG